jgi:hypothetical protein
MQTSNSTRYSGVGSYETRVGIQITGDRYMFPGMPNDRRHKPQTRSGSWCNWWSALVAGRGQEENLGADIAINGVHEALAVAPGRTTRLGPVDAPVLAGTSVDRRRLVGLCGWSILLRAAPRLFRATPIAAGAPLAAGPGSVSIGEQVMLHTQRQSQGAGDQDLDRR